MANENYSIFTKLGQTRVFISPISPKIIEKREKREREQEQEKKELAQSDFYSVNVDLRENAYLG